MSEHIPRNTRIDVFELYENGVSLFKEFYNEIEKESNLFSDLVSAIRIIEDTSNMNLRPKTQFRQLHISKLKCKVYEAKKGSIRVYLFREEKKGRVIVFGGKKDNQKEDIKHLEKIIQAYYLEQNGKH